MLRNISLSNKCIPWNMADVMNERNICHGRDALALSRKVEDYNPAGDPNCNCLPDCEKIIYSVDSTPTPLNGQVIKGLCEEIGSEDEMNMDTFHASTLIYARDNHLEISKSAHMIKILNTGEPYDINNINAKYNGLGELLAPQVEYTFDEFCQDRIKNDHTFVIVYIKEGTMIQLLKDVKLSLGDKVGIFGGTIGVFTGLSFISPIEILYFLMAFLLTNFYSRRNVKLTPMVSRNSGNGDWKKNVHNVQVARIE